MDKLMLPAVDHIIAVASGKGGVGKTTVTVNLALALQQLGARVGIFDADIFGPNVPIMLGIHRRQEGSGFMAVARSTAAVPYVSPLQRFGLKLMSVGLLIAESQVINPPPEVAGQLVVQALRDVKWAPLDYLLLDLPPAAGQPQEDLIKRMALAGAILVTTPQDLSLLDVSRSLKLFADSRVPILGIVENMSYFICPHCDEKHEIFQRSTRWQPSGLDDVPLLGRIPLTPAISQGINQAHPLVESSPDSVQSAAFLEVARAVEMQLSTTNS